MYEWFLQYGVYGLFGVSFLAATILPFSSEAVLFGVIKAGIPRWEAVAWASAGNCLACLVNFFLGRIFCRKAENRLNRSRTGRKALVWMNRYGLPALLLSWLPFIGDPLTIVAGMTRISLAVFVLIVFSLRIGRYVVIAYFTSGG